jgi:F-type H+-transporting ATPase subunit gamma
MSDSLERAVSRLNNIRAIEPLLSALRTISLGTWQMALRTLTKLEIFEDHLESVLSEVFQVIDPKIIQENKPTTKLNHFTESVVLIIGTERGLCGRFNKNLIEKSIIWIKKSGLQNYKIWSMGSRLHKELDKAGINTDWHKTLPSSRLISYPEIYRLTDSFQEQFNLNLFSQLFVLTNQITNGGNNEFQIYKLFPNQDLDYLIKHSAERTEWPPSIFETSPESVYNKTIPHFLASGLYRTFLKSSAAEHATRYNLMQDAKDNASKIVADLNLIINTARKKQITMEMQELASGAGLLEKNI